MQTVKRRFVFIFHLSAVRIEKQYHFAAPVAEPSGPQRRASSHGALRIAQFATCLDDSDGQASAGMN